MNETMAALAAIEAQVHSMGANDSESGDLAQVRTLLQKGEITSEEALARAEGIRDSKQAYH